MTDVIKYGGQVLLVSGRDDDTELEGGAGRISHHRPDALAAIERRDLIRRLRAERGRTAQCGQADHGRHG